MADVITWAPRVGATGDDRYDPDETRINEGTASGTFSDPPTLTEVNAATGLNQLVAEVRRRSWGTSASTNYYVPGALPLSPDWFTPESRTDRGTWNDLKGDIDTLRTTEGLSSYSWTLFPVAAETRITRAHLIEIRKALSTTEYILYRYKSDHTSGNNGIRGYTPSYPTVTTKVLWSDCKAGEYSAYKYRGYIFFRLPSDWPASLTGDLRCWYSRGSGTRTIEIYRSNSHLGALDTGDWGNLDNLEYTATNTTIAASSGTWYRVNLALTATLSGGTNYTLIFTHQEENTDSNPSSSLDEINSGPGGSGESKQPRLVLS